MATDGCRFFLAAALLTAVYFREAAPLAMRKSSAFAPDFIAARSQRGRAPRPAHVSPFGPRYFGGTLRPLSEVLRVVVCPSDDPPSPNRASCRFKSPALRLNVVDVRFAPKVTETAMPRIDAMCHNRL
jgi:hypothetical protein